MTPKPVRSILSVGLVIALVGSTLGLVGVAPAGANGGPEPVPAPDAGSVRTVSTVTAPHAGFTDIPLSSPYAPAVAWGVEAGVFNAPDALGGNFSPQGLVSRRQLAVSLWRLEGRPEPSTPCELADVPAGSSWLPAVCWALETGAMVPQGTSGGQPLFRPNGIVSRAGAALALYRLAGEPAVPEKASYTDVPAQRAYAPAVDWMSWFGFLQPSSTFSPSLSLSRRTLVSFLFQVAGRGDAWDGGVGATGSVGQVSAVGEPGTVVSLYAADADGVPTGGPLETAVLDVDGGVLWRAGAPGDYVVAVGDGDGGSQGWGVTVTEVDPTNVEPVPSLYAHQKLRAGFNYITTRDGTQLAAMVTFPSGPGPYPTLVEYSGYDLTDPWVLTSGSSPYRLLAPQFGYALVQVQMRGTGCSGGAFDYFEPLQNLDGYDAVETVAAQSWVKPNAQTGKRVVGTVGISYPGISQLFLASTAPPSLAAITPVSVVADMARSVLRPGGILNDGFAVGWAEGAVARGKPARKVNGVWTGGVNYVARKINEGDATCRLSQRLHGQQADLLGRIENATFELPTDEYLSPMRLVGNIKAPTLMVGSWQDEQTGGMWPILASQFDENTYLRMIAQNGTHIEPIMPENLKAAFEHLAVFVKGARPSFNADLLNNLVGLAAGEIIGSGVKLPPGGQLKFTPSRYDDRSIYPTFNDVKQDYLKLPRLTVRFENGAGPTGKAGGSLVPAETRYFSGFPLNEDGGPSNEVTERTWYLRTNGSGVGELVDSASDRRSGEDSMTYAYQPGAGPTNLWTKAKGCSDWEPRPSDDTGKSCYNWVDPGPANSASFIAPAFDANTFMIGGGLVELNMVWNPEGTPEADYTDVEVTISEVRPDGKEVYIQSGWARTFYCENDPTYSLPRLPWATATEADGEACALSPGEERRVQVPIFPFGHIFREGSRLRLSVDSPGGSRVLWNFVSAPDDADITLRLGDNVEASTLKLPIVTKDLTPTRNATTGVRTWNQRNIKAPQLSSPPRCGVLRSQPCRTYTSPSPPP